MVKVSYDVAGVTLTVVCEATELAQVLEVVERRAAVAAALRPSVIASRSEAVRALGEGRAAAKAEERPDEIAPDSLASATSQVASDAEGAPVRAKYDGNDAYARKVVVSEVIRERGEPMSPKGIVAALRERSDFAMSVEDWGQAVRYVLTRAFPQDFVNVGPGQWLTRDLAIERGWIGSEDSVEGSSGT